MTGEKCMEASKKLDKTSENLRKIFDVVNDVKNERHLLNIIYLAQKEGFIDKIYEDFRFSDLGPFSPKMDFDLEFLKIEDILFETDNPLNTIYLTGKGKSESYKYKGEIHHPEKLFTLKNIDIDDLLDINRFIFFGEKYGENDENLLRLKEFYNLSDQRIEKLNQNLSLLRFK